MNNETEQILILNTSANITPSTSQKLLDIIGGTQQINNENVEDVSNVCRTCAGVSEFVIPIFSGDGLQNNLADKIHKHLPIKVSEQDVLPLVVCYQCASTLLAWHELFKCCVQVDTALRSRLPDSTINNKKPELPHVVSGPTAETKIPSKRDSELPANQLTEENLFTDDDSASKSKAFVEKPTKLTVDKDGRKFGMCGHCDKSVALSSWKRHARSHEAAKRYSCPTCGLGFNDGGNLMRHARTVHFKRRPHICPVCHKTFSRNSHLEDHVKSHSKNREFVCDVCGKASKSGAALRMHRRTHGDCRFKCMECGSMFKRSGELRAHVTVHTGEKAHLCGCGRAFRLRSQLTAHARVHEKKGTSKDGKQPDIIRFKQIAGSEKRRDPPKYVDRSTSQPAERHISCKYCTIEFTESTLEEHWVAVHAESLFHCDDCNSYVDRRELFTHMSNHADQYNNASKVESKKIRKTKMDENDDTGDDEETPESPDSQTSQGSGREDNADNANEATNEFSDHSDTDNGFGPLPESVFEAIEDSQDNQPNGDETAPSSEPSKPIEKPDKIKPHKKSRTCPICLKEFTASSSYFYHLKHYHKTSKEHECDVCGKHFSTKYNLVQHGYIHTGECKYQCKSCGIRIKSKASLYIHEQIHDGVKKYTCAQCHRSFRWKTHLVRHMKRHSAEKSFVCKICGRGFSINGDMLRHMRTHTAGNFTCAKCGLKFAQLRYLKVHLDRKHSAG